MSEQIPEKIGTDGRPGSNEVQKGKSEMLAAFESRLDSVDPRRELIEKMIDDISTKLSREWVAHGDDVQTADYYFAVLSPEKDSKPLKTLINLINELALVVENGYAKRDPVLREKVSRAKIELFDAVMRAQAVSELLTKIYNDHYDQNTADFNAGKYRGKPELEAADTERINRESDINYHLAKSIKTLQQAVADFKAATE